ncbi:MAG: efflux RND transporter permease subunit [Pseudomonadota bacterium]
MSVTEFALEKNRVTAVAILTIILFGIITYIDMPRAEDPGFIIRTAVVTTQFPGASPERVEMLVTDKLEKVIQEIPELDFVASTSKAGSSVINVNVREEFKNMRPIWDKLRRKVDAARSELPDGVIGPQVDDEFGDVFGFIIGISGADFSDREIKNIADEVRDELLLIPDAAKVELSGVRDERIFVEYSNARLARLGISPSQLAQALIARNIVQPGGEVRGTFETVFLEPTGSFESVGELADTILNVPNSSEVIRLKDLADVYRDYVDPPTQIMRVNGERGLAISVSMREGGNNITLGKDISAALTRAQEIYPIGIDFIPIQIQSAIVEKKISDFESNLLQAVGIVVVVMLLFLGVRTGLIVATLIPAAIIAAFPVMSIFGIGLDQMSLASLIIALGMLVDNAIVMSESIMVRIDAGEQSKSACISAANELKIPLLTSSLTTAAAFLPIFLSESGTGEYTASLFKVVTITLLCSWVLALTLVPLLCRYLLKPSKRQAQTRGNRFYRVYSAGLLTILRNRFVSFVVIALIFAAALVGLSTVPNIFFPPNDRATFTMAVETPVGTPLARTNQVTQEIESYMRKNLLSSEIAAGITTWGTFIGSGAPRFNVGYAPKPRNPNYAIAMVNVSDANHMLEATIPSLTKYIQANFPDVDATIRPLELGAPAWPPVAIRISGRDNDTLFDIVEAMKERLRNTVGTFQVSEDWGPKNKKAVIDIDNARARLAGINHEDIATSMQSYFSGITATEFRERDDLIPIILRSNTIRGSDDTNFGSIDVYSQQTGKAVPFEQVADVRLDFEPGVIERRNRLRTVTVEALLQPGYTSKQIVDELRPWLEETATEWPFGYGWEFGGEVETSGKANAAIGEKLPVGGIIIVLLLVAQFNSIRRPAIILLTIPLAIVGVTIGLILARSYFGFMTLLGVISLAGIVINNAIVLLDTIRINIEDHEINAPEAILLAAQQRLRPILLTTATTVGGMLPLWLGGGPMWEPMAVSIIFGLLFSTLLTLVVVPLLYSVFFGVNFRTFKGASVTV